MKFDTYMGMTKSVLREKMSILVEEKCRKNNKVEKMKVSQRKRVILIFMSKLSKRKMQERGIYIESTLRM